MAFAQSDEAEDNDAIEAIRYMENSCNTRIRDYNYNEMKRLRQENIRLKNLLFVANNCREKLGKG